MNNGKNNTGKKKVEGKRIFGKKRLEVNKMQKWECRICYSMNEDSSMFCVKCYIELHYYFYVNSHFFVTRDDEYLETFYKRPWHQFIRKSSQYSLCSTMEDQIDSKNVELDFKWVENLFEGE